jgi:methyl-accepting chemotaxis protein
VEITKKVSDAFLQQNQKIKDTEEIFSSLNKEIEKVHDSVMQINDEVEELDAYKDVIASGVTALDDSAKENADSAEIASSNVDGLKSNVNDCDNAMHKVLIVSQELAGFLNNTNTDNKPQQKSAYH